MRSLGHGQVSGGLVLAHEAVHSLKDICADTATWSGQGSCRKQQHCVIMLEATPLEALTRALGFPCVRKHVGPTA